MELLLKYFDDFTETQMEQFNALGPLYQEWNEKINVISRKDMDSLYERHVLHSLSIAAVFEFEAGSNVLDLGTGGGFPGIPLAIFFPEVQFHLVDSIGKKIKVVQEVAGAIGLKNLTAAHTRVESIKDRKFDTVVSRAVAPLKELWQWSRPLIKMNNQASNGLICLKGGDLHQEIADSGCRPKMMGLYTIFPEESFKEKFILQVKP